MNIILPRTRSIQNDFLILLGLTMIASLTLNSWTVEAFNDHEVQSSFGRSVQGFQQQPSPKTDNSWSRGGGGGGGCEGDAQGPSFSLNLNLACTSIGACQASPGSQKDCGPGFVCCKFWCGSRCRPLNWGGAGGSIYGGDPRSLDRHLVPQPRPPPPGNYDIVGGWGGGGGKQPGGWYPPPRPQPTPSYDKGLTLPPIKPTPPPRTCKCYIGEFDCNDGKYCIANEYVCNGKPECPNGLDEARILCGGKGDHRPPPMTKPPPIQPKHCLLGQFQCFDGRCIPERAICDGRFDCVNGDDESPGRCPKNVKPQCFPNQFKCGDGSCIPRTSLCDGRSDCPRGLDESPEICKNIRPPSACQNGYQCGSGECIPYNLKCDCFKNCRDGSDEDPRLCQRGDIYNKCSNLQPPGKVY